MRPPALVLVVSVALLGGCTPFTKDAASSRPAAARVQTAAPPSGLTVVGDADPVASAAATSKALFQTSDVVVVARDGDRAGTLLGASAAVGLGVPLLVEPKDGDPAAPALTAELGRLKARTLLTVGDARPVGATATQGSGPAVVSVAADPRALAEVSALRLGTAPPVRADGEPAVVAALDPGRPVALLPEAAGQSPSGQSPSGQSAGASGKAARIPDVTRAQPPESALVLATGTPESLAGIATARAAGVRVQLTGGPADPRASADIGAALSKDRPRSVLALGTGFGGARGLDWKLATAARNAQLPGGGQLLFPGCTLVALYGTPGTPALGVLGEQGVAESVQLARNTAAPYKSLVGTPVVPAFEIIATVASSSAGPDGSYSAEAEVDQLRLWVEEAEKAGIYVVLDLQPGRKDFLSQARRYQSLLEKPNVGLALDPEWRLGPTEMHLVQAGSVRVEEVNDVITWLADLTREKALPQKLLAVHQFQLRMVRDRERLDTSRDELAVMVHADGQGSQPEKQATWRALHNDAPKQPLYWGWKNFYDEDKPMLTPEQTIAQVEPRPELITYQ